MRFKLPKPIFCVPQTGPVHRGTVIFLHGSGDNGPNLWKYIECLNPDFQFKHLKILLPSAPVQPFTAFGGEMSNVWFNRIAISRSCKELTESVNAMADELKELINEEIASGTPADKIIVGGFSMGGCMAMHMGFRYVTDIAGVFALSSYLSDDTQLNDTIPKNKRLPPLYQWHGSRDDLVPLSWGNQAFDMLQNRGVKGEFHVGANALHELTRDSIVKLRSWILKILPEI